jgi:cell division septum initiation protein DivIVA
MRLTPAAVRETRLKRAPLGRRGIDEEQVGLFLADVERELVLLFNERTELQNEVTRLRQRLLHVTQPGAAPGSAVAVMPNPEDASAQAVKILAKAQQTADEYVADAEDYSRQLAEDARRHYEEILSEARERARALVDGSHQRASMAAEAAVNSLSGAGGRGGGERGDLEAEVAYLRTFSQVYRVHLRSYLEALLRNVDEWERAENVPAAPAAARQPAPQPAPPPPGLQGGPGPYPPAQQAAHQPALGSAFRGGGQGPAG